MLRRIYEIGNLATKFTKSANFDCDFMSLVTQYYDINTNSVMYIANNCTQAH